MGAVEWDGIYGESDTFLPVADVEAAEREAAAAIYPTGNESLLDFDLERARRRHR
ncbi:hypothetical protein QE367_000385 [Microbacterium paludicola]|uniref:Uncharacterized protein n=1 Tax=Microbacterium paludicola TaxID=300019 RepID=A0ABU1HX09_9MICO|nr:hypothetical protein [Microbacterium paludicola]MDR6166181.1 hypothetical protein [Microbacterium paludicola]